MVVEEDSEIPNADDIAPASKLPANYYFDNDLVERLLVKYLETGCTDVALRDEIMSHASELIINIIRTHNLHTIYGGRDESSFNDLFQISWVQIESTLYKFKPGHAKVFNMWCAAPDTMLLTSDGVRELADVSLGVNVDVRGHDGDHPAVAGLIRPKTKSLKITTELGYSIECAPQHSLLCLSGQSIDYHKTSTIKPGQLVAIQYNQNYFANNDNIRDIKLESSGEWDNPGTITEELAYVLGLYIAEGSYSYGKLVIYNIDDDVVHRLVENTFGLNFIHEPEFQRISLCNIRFIEFIEKLGFGKCRCWHKRIPQRLLRMSRNNIVAMIRGMFDGDGHSSRHNGNVGYTSTSTILINQLRMLLLNLGMLTKISEDKRNTSQFTRRGKSYASRRRHAFQLLMSTTDSIKFYNIIGFAVKRKHNKKKFLPKPKQYIYGITDEFRKLHQKYAPCSWDDLGSVVRNKSKRLIETVTQKLSLFTNTMNRDYQFIHDRLNEVQRDRNNIIWLPIRSITKSRNRMCDIMVQSKDHSYMSNGFISHNSQVARTVMLAAIKKNSRDKKNAESYRLYLDDQAIKRPVIFNRFMKEARSLCDYNDEHSDILNALEALYREDEKPYEGLIDKLTKRSRLSRPRIVRFIKMLRLMSFEFTDSAIGEAEHQEPVVKPTQIPWSKDED